MSDSMNFDFSELNTLAADLGDVADDAGKNIVQAVTGSARQTQKEWRRNVGSSKHFPRLAGAVTYDVESNAAVTGSSVSAEIGYDRSRPQGPLGHIAEYGDLGSAPRSDGQHALEATQEDFVRGLIKATADAEKRNNL
ncbi:hypothetical protein [Leifsonia poae]|uniref:hypothetical protein n=1 Tax=Leifsonia poae TaxID=110933 RepID=UPI001CBFD429|nr:hypothetical protein [Leifsonia poae]